MTACEEFREVAPDLALGLLTGADRAAALAHAATCAECRRYLAGMVQVADELLLLAPSVEPAIGFESRVMTRLAASGAFSAGAATEGRPASPAPAALSQTIPIGLGKRRRWLRPMTVAAAILVVLAAVTGLAMGRHQGRTAALGSEAHAANQLAARTAVVWSDGGKSSCQLVAFPPSGGQPARLVIHLNEPSDVADTYQVYAVPTNNGPEVLIGTVTVTDAEGTLTAVIPTSAGRVDAVRVVDASQRTKYWATFAPV
jgi:hypothetical protein